MLPPVVLTSLMRTATSIGKRLGALAAAERGGGDAVAPRLPSSASALGGACFPYVGRLRVDTPTEHLAGDARPPPIVLPVELTRVPSAVHSLEDVQLALRRCDELCSLLFNQRLLLRNSSAQP